MDLTAEGYLLSIYDRLIKKQQEVDNNFFLSSLSTQQHLTANDVTSLAQPVDINPAGSGTTAGPTAVPNCPVASRLAESRR